jgi:DNA-binding transcriptional LysR family regulator
MIQGRRASRKSYENPTVPVLDPLCRFGDQSSESSLALGFIIGHDSIWLPEALKLLRDEWPNIHVLIFTQNSPQLADALLQRRIDAALPCRDDIASPP